MQRDAGKKFMIKKLLIFVHPLIYAVQNRWSIYFAVPAVIVGRISLSINAQRSSLEPNRSGSFSESLTLFYTGYATLFYTVLVRVKSM